MNARKIIIGLVLPAAVAGALIWRFVLTGRDPSGEYLLRVSGNIELIDVEMAFKIPGLVRKRLVDEGDKVAEGKDVAVLDTKDLEAELAVRQAELAAAEAVVKEMEAGSREEEEKAAKAAMEKADAALKGLLTSAARQQIEAARAADALKVAELEEARLFSEWDRAKDLLKGEVIPKEAYDRQKSAHDVAMWRRKEAEEQLKLTDEPARKEQIEQAQKALDQATAQWKLVEQGPRDEVKEQARAKRDQAKAAVELARIRIGYATVKAPFDGVVLSKNAEEGEYVAAGTPVVTIGKMKSVWLRAYVQEEDLSRVKQGQRARVTTDSSRGKEYEGRVSFIASEAEFTPKSVQTPKERVKLVYRIKIDIENPEMELKRGMPADAEIFLDSPASGVPAAPEPKSG